MKLSNKQRAFVDFLPVSLVRTNVLRMYAITLLLVPFFVSYYSDMVGTNYRWWIYVVYSIDAILVLVSIPILIKPKFFLGVFHLFSGFTSLFVSIIFFICFIFEANSIKLGIVNIGFALAIYLIAVFTVNFLILRTTGNKVAKDIIQKE